MLQDLLTLLPVRDVGRLQMADRESLAAAEALRARVLLARGWSTGWSWRKAHACEAALFRDLPSNAPWTPGPNEGAAGNVMERQGTGDEEWLWLSDGTDWQAFQGGSRVVSEVGIRPEWVSFRVRIATPALSAANLALSSEGVRWGLSRPIVLFSYRGDEAPTQRRCFMVETCNASMQGGRPVAAHACHMPEQVTSEQTYEIAIHLNWCQGVLSVFINGQMHVSQKAFETSSPIRLAAIYNWRSNARAAFSELMLGNTCPYDLRGGDGRLQPTKQLCRHRALQTLARPLLGFRSGGVRPAAHKISKLPWALAALAVLAALAGGVASRTLFQRAQPPANEVCRPGECPQLGS